MVLPLYLAMNASEMRHTPLPDHVAWMACQFSSSGAGICNLPDFLPAGSMLILNDQVPWQGHSISAVASQLTEATAKFGCESILLDFQRPENKEFQPLIQEIISRSSVPVAVSELYALPFPCPVFLSPAPLHTPLEAFLAPWEGREIWLEAGLCQEAITVTEEGSKIQTIYPTHAPAGRLFDEPLHCYYHTRIDEKAVTFTLFDTPDSLERKLSAAHALGVSRAVGLYQELGTWRKM